MPYVINGKTYRRVTEVLAGLNCQYIPYIRMTIPEEERQERHHFISFPGSNMHRQIAENMPSTLPHITEKIVSACNWECTNYGEEDDEIQKQFRKIVEQEDSPLADMYSFILEDRTNAFYNFLADFSPDIIFSEFTFLSDELDMAGTVDACYVIDVTEDNINLIEDTSLLVGDKAVVILDWKCGRSIQKTYGMQMMSYYTMMKEKRIIDIIVKEVQDHFNMELPPKVVLWSGILGKRRKRKDCLYTIKEYHPNDFDLISGIEMALEIYNNPQPVVTYGMHCTFCSLILYCPFHIFSLSKTDKITKGENNGDN